MSDLNNLLVSPETSFREVMACIDRNAKGIALVVDRERHLLGTITDGDVRRAILAGIDLSVPAHTLLTRRSPSSRPTPLTAPFGADAVTLLRLMHEYGINHIPLVNESRQVVDLVAMQDLTKEYELPLKAVIMAGGRGMRLRPLTEELPKPMLPVGDRPLMEITLQRLREAGIKRVNITTHYKGEKITEHFGDGRKFGVELSYISEDRPLGTAGALSLLEKTEDTLLIINGDILTDLDFRSMLMYHREHQADLTVAVRQYDVKVPYGVIECQGVAVTSVTEKPVFDFFVNAGIYLLEPVAHAFVPTTGDPFDMTDLIQRLVEAGRTVVSFPIREYWLDIGQPAEYQQAQEAMKC